MKTIKNITSKHINKIYSIIVGEERFAGKIEWTPEKDFVTAVFKKEESISQGYDYVEFGIQITSNLEVQHVWYYSNKIGTAVEYHPLHNHHKITKYLMDEGFDV